LALRTPGSPPKWAVKIRNPKHEIRNKFKSKEKRKIQKARPVGYLLKRSGVGDFPAEAEMSMSAGFGLP